MFKEVNIFKRNNIFPKKINFSNILKCQNCQPKKVDCQKSSKLYFLSLNFQQIQKCKIFQKNLNL